MVNKLFGKKIGMTRYFLEGGKSEPVTVVKMEPCVVTQKKTLEKEGYNAIQIGFGARDEKRTNKPLKGHFEASGGKCFTYLNEVRVDDVDAFELGQEIKSDIFSIGDTVHVRGRSKGRGFAGVIKRWGFSGGRKTHGSRSHRVPGSIGCSADPAKVVKGRKMPGRMGYTHVTTKNLKVVDIRPDMDVLLIRGPVPGAPGNLLEIVKAS
ncbi:MAG: 50S ribosomal protein L3 [Deltaproteobacteria bacterium]|nr:50S ribosomal protein L3 [Deltaproteobacteria bacterium]